MKILIAGDLCPRARMDLNCVGEEYRNFISEVIKSEIKQSDFSIANLEAPIIDADSQSIPYKINLKTNSNVVGLLKDTGFNGVTLANNHLRDYLDYGVINTLKTLKDASIDCVGAGSTISEARKILYKEIKGKVVAFVNVCESEFSIALPDRPGAASLDLVELFYQVEEAKQKADYAIVIIHGGHEHYQLPSPRMKKTYRWLIDIGADAVINHHQHCFSGYEVYKDRPIFYGIGNFCFDWEGKRNGIWNYGYLVKLNLDEKISFDVVPYNQCDEMPVVRELTPDEYSAFNNTINKLNGIISNDDALREEFRKLCTQRSSNMRLALSPYSNRYLLGLCARRMLPDFGTLKRKFFMYDYVNCEAHRDILLEYLKIDDKFNK